jgi:feruloyl-CoA synthase
VINTQRMLCANQQQRMQVWPFVAASPPVVVDWLPWSHTFGANHNFNLVLRQGGTLYVDAGRPAPPLFGQTVANLRDVAPTIYFNVPRGYDMLVTALEADAELRRNFFSRLQVVFYAAAALPPHLWDALRRLAAETVGEPVVVTSAWGSTETAPLAADCHFQAERSGVIGLPVPGTELKLVPSGEKLEVRVRGPNVTPGYWERPDLTAEHFDAEGFYRIGDAVRFVDPERPEAGLLFDGRVAEDFKLDSGTWVNVGTLRVRAIAALAPVASDGVVAGHARRDVGFLILPLVVACRGLAGLDPGAPVAEVLAHTSVRGAVRRGLAALRAEGTGSSLHATRAVLLTEPPSIDRGEITDKGYLNQRAVLSARSAAVEALYGEASEAITLEA